MTETTATQRPVVSSGVLIGIGLGGFVDGILIHQILQWHHMLSARIPPIDLVSVKVNMVWDGFFHAFTWLATLLGVVLLWRAGRRSEVPWVTSTFAGALILGWGLFNVIEGLIDHQILGVHHVHPGTNQLAWDLGFLAFGAIEIALGLALVTLGTRTRQAARPPARAPQAAYTPS